MSLKSELKANRARTVRLVAVRTARAAGRAKMHGQAMNRDRLLATLRNMETYGGSFSKNLALAWFNADDTNRDKLAAAFPELLEKYAPEKKWAQTATK